MPRVRTCFYAGCYHNDNHEHTCLHDVITVSAVGVCETLTHCDDYECGYCENYEVCTKEKRERYLREKGGSL